MLIYFQLRKVSGEHNLPGKSQESHGGVHFPEERSRANDPGAGDKVSDSYSLQETKKLSR